MRYWLVGVLLVVAACSGARPRSVASPRERVYVGVDGCREPQVGYVRDHVADLDALDGPEWRLAIAPRRADVIVACADFAELCAVQGRAPSCEPGAARYRRHTPYVEIDPSRANGEFAFTAAFLHELVHWSVARGPHPDRAGLHVCEDPSDGEDCWSGGYGLALMNPQLGSRRWRDTDDMFGDVPQFSVTALDVAYYRFVTERR